MSQRPIECDYLVYQKRSFRVKIGLWKITTTMIGYIRVFIKSILSFLSNKSLEILDSY